MRTLLCSLGHIASYQELIRLVGSPDSAAVPFRQAGPSATIRRIRSNIYVCTHLSSDELASARIGAPLDCVTALARHGVPVPESAGCLHLRFRHGDRRASARRQAEPLATRAHWSAPRWPLIGRLEVPLSEALRQALTSCLDVTESLAAITSLIAAKDTPTAKTHYVFQTSSTVAPHPNVAPQPTVAPEPAVAPQPGPAASLRAEQLAMVIATIPASARGRLVRWGLPPEVDVALKKLL